MKPGFVLLILLGAAALEVCGDAIVRRGLHTASLGPRLGVILLGGLVLTVYGVAVNLPPWNFGRLLGVYVVLFFLAAQTVNAVAFGVAPTRPVLLGGALIVAGGTIMTFWRA